MRSWNKQHSYGRNWQSQHWNRHPRNACIIEDIDKFLPGNIPNNDKSVISCPINYVWGKGWIWEQSRPLFIWIQPSFQRSITFYRNPHAVNRYQIGTFYHYQTFYLSFHSGISLHIAIENIDRTSLLWKRSLDAKSYSIRFNTRLYHVSIFKSDSRIKSTSFYAAWMIRISYLKTT